MKDNQALSQDIDIPKIMKLQDRINTNSAAIEGIVNKLVKDYCKQLDEYVLFIQGVLQDTKNPPTNEELDDFTLNLPVLIYFTGEAQESLGIRNDISKAIRQEVFNTAYEAAKINKSTIADKTAQAELESMNETIVNVAYNSAYKKIKLRMDAANEILQSVKKVMTRRISEFELAKVDMGRNR